MRTLIYSKLETAGGNATVAHRLAKYLSRQGEVILRDIAPELPDDPAACQREVLALRQLVRDQAIGLAIGIHCYRAGVLLHQAFTATAGAGEALPYVLLASGTDLNVNLQKNPDRAALRQAIADAAGIISLSPELHDKVETLLAEQPAEKRPPHALILQAPEITTDSRYSLRATLGLAPTQQLILLPAGIRPVKDICLAIESAAQALLEHPDHVLVILGPVIDPDYHARCASLIGEWRLRHRALKGRMHLLDGLPRADYLAALREADLLLNTSESEAISNAVVEALGAGVPVLARDIAGNRAVITHESTGLLFDRLPAFQRQYRRLFADPALRQRLIANGQAFYQTHCNVAAEQAAYRALIDRALAFRR